MYANIFCSFLIDRISTCHITGHKQRYWYAASLWGTSRLGNWVKQQLRNKIKYPKTMATFPFRDSQTVKHAYIFVEHVLTI